MDVVRRPYKHLLAVIYITLIIVLFEMEEVIQSPATIRLLENAICQKHYAAINSNIAPIEERVCKVASVQQKLAVIRAWYSFCSNIPGQCQTWYLSA